MAFNIYEAHPAEGKLSYSHGYADQPGAFPSGDYTAYANSAVRLGTTGWTYSHPASALSVDVGYDNTSTQWQKIKAPFTGNVDKVSLFQHYVNVAGKTLKMCLINPAGNTVLSSGSWTSDGAHENYDVEVTLAAPVPVVAGQDYWIGWSYSDGLMGQVRVGYDGNGSESGVGYDSAYADFPEVPVIVTGTNRYRVGLHPI